MNDRLDAIAYRKAPALGHEACSYCRVCGNCAHWREFKAGETYRKLASVMKRSRCRLR
jgi:hypothetical protein